MIDSPANNSLERTGDAAAEARNNGDAGSCKRMRGANPGRSTRSREAGLRHLSATIPIARLSEVRVASLFDR